MTSGVYKRTKENKKAIKDNHWSKDEVTRNMVIKKLSNFRKGKSSWNKGKKGLQVAWNKGLTKETDERVKKINYSNNPNRKNCGFKKGYTPYNKGKKQTEKWMEMRRKLVLPKKDSTIEVKIQNFLKQMGIEFFTHQYIKIEHGYQCDVLIPSMNMVIECDGDYWHKYPIGRDIDRIRTRELLQKGFRVLRLWEHEIRAMDLNGFSEVIKLTT